MVNRLKLNMEMAHWKEALFLNKEACEDTSQIEIKKARLSVL